MKVIHAASTRNCLGLPISIYIMRSDFNSRTDVISCVECLENEIKSGIMEISTKLYQESIKRVNELNFTKDLNTLIGESNGNTCKQ
jgi:hypothetical protein